MRSNKTAGRVVKSLEKLELGLLGRLMTFGDIIRDIREMDLEMMQVQFGQLLGMSRQQVSDLERGRRLASVEKITEMAKTLKQLPGTFI